MATSCETSLTDVTKALEKLTCEETEHLITSIGISRQMISDVMEDECSNPNIHAIHAGASWEKIISGLNEMGKHTLANEIATQYNCSQSPDTSNPASTLPTIPGRVHASPVQEIQQIEETPLSTPLSTGADAQSFTVSHERVEAVIATILALEEKFVDLV